MADLIAADFNTAYFQKAAPCERIEWADKYIFIKVGKLNANDDFAEIQSWSSVCRNSLAKVLPGIVAGYLWLFAVAYLFHIIMDVRIPIHSDHFDHFYDSGPPREGRYGGRAGEVYGSVLQIGFIGFRVWLAVGLLWGFLQGRLDLRRLLKIKRRPA